MATLATPIRTSIRHCLVRGSANSTFLTPTSNIFAQLFAANNSSSSTSRPGSSNSSSSPGQQTSTATNQSSNKQQTSSTQQQQTDNDENSKKEPFVLQQDPGWFSRILKGAPGGPGGPHAAGGGGGSSATDGATAGAGGGAHSAHSGLGTKKLVYELQFHKVYPDAVDKYLHAYSKLVEHATHNDFSMQLVGSWVVQTGGDQDQVVNLWKHSGGYAGMENDEQRINPYRSGNNSEAGMLTRDYARFLRKFSFTLAASCEACKCGIRICTGKRQNQYLLAFSFWGDPTTKVRQGSNLYEMRSYSLRPGTMVDWANQWARAIQIRKKDSGPVGGFFSQVGHMYKVYHMWSYVDLEDRRQSRDNAWRYPGWDECVQATVPLIKDMQSRLMYATPFSPLQ